MNLSAAFNRLGLAISVTIAARLRKHLQEVGSVPHSHWKQLRSSSVLVSSKSSYQTETAAIDTVGLVY